MKYTKKCKKPYRISIVERDFKKEIKLKFSIITIIFIIMNKKHRRMFKSKQYREVLLHEFMIDRILQALTINFIYI